MRLCSDRLILRAWQDSDRAPFAAMSADPAVMQYLRALPTREACDAWIDYQIAHQTDHGFCLWAMELRESGGFVGAVGLLKVGFSASFTPAVEAGWRLAREAWGQGLATEAARRALAFGFTDLGLDEIVAYAASANQASQNVMRKLGMMRDEASDFDHPRLAEGDPLRRHALYRLARAEWHQPDSPNRVTACRWG
jgi:RimJ/RimL family protein N-acetyltransferase